MKAVSGDDDLPKRDDIGERRRKHELQVLARAGIVSDDEADGDAETDDEDDAMDEDSGSEDEFYKQAKQQRAAKIEAKAEIYSRFVSAAGLYLVDVLFPSYLHSQIRILLQKHSSAVIA